MIRHAFLIPAFLCAALTGGVSWAQPPMGDGTTVNLNTVSLSIFADTEVEYTDDDAEDEDDYRENKVSVSVSYTPGS
jgi:hypothetical protein